MQNIYIIVTPAVLTMCLKPTHKLPRRHEASVPVKEESCQMPENPNTPLCLPAVCYHLAVSSSCYKPLGNNKISKC